MSPSRVVRILGGSESAYEGHVNVMIPFKTYAGVARYLKAIASPRKPKDMINSIKY